MSSNVIDEITRVIARQVVTELRGQVAWIDQHETQLGRNRHCAAVRRRIREMGQAAQCAIVGRRHLMSPSAYLEELGRLMLPNTAAEPVPVRKAEATVTSIEEMVQARIDARIAKRRSHG